LALLLTLVAAPLVALGGTQPVVLGAVLTALTVCFLWLERLPLRPGLGVAALLALAVAGALPLASAADGEDPWFDYRAFAEGLGSDDPIRFNWGHSYGPITWPREGSEVLRVASEEPHYWKLRTLDDFDGRIWRDGEAEVGDVEPEVALQQIERDARRDADADQRQRHEVAGGHAERVDAAEELEPPSRVDRRVGAAQVGHGERVVDETEQVLEHGVTVPQGSDELRPAAAPRGPAPSRRPAPTSRPRCGGPRRGAPGRIGAGNRWRSRRRRG
jgi:hypothetical protein